MNPELRPPEHMDRWAVNERLSIRRGIDEHIRCFENGLSGFDDDLAGLIRHPKPPLAATLCPRWGAAAQHGCC